MNRTSILAGLSVAAMLAGCGAGSQGAGSSKEGAGATAEKTVSLEAAAVQQVPAEKMLATAKSGAAACSFDSVDGNYGRTAVKLEREKPHVFRGWVLDETKHPAGNFQFRLKGDQSFQIAASTGIQRPDVGSYLGDPSLASAGFNFSVAIKSIPAGLYAVELVTGIGAASRVCDTGKTLLIQ